MARVSGSTKGSRLRLNLRSNSGRKVLGGSGREKVLVTLGRDQLRVSCRVSIRKVSI